MITQETIRRRHSHLGEDGRIHCVVTELVDTVEDEDCGDLLDDFERARQSLIPPFGEEDNLDHNDPIESFLEYVS